MQARRSRPVRRCAPPHRGRDAEDWHGSRPGLRRHDGGAGSACRAAITLWLGLRRSSQISPWRFAADRSGAHCTVVRVENGSPYDVAVRAERLGPARLPTASVELNGLQTPALPRVRRGSPGWEAIPVSAKTVLVSTLLRPRRNMHRRMVTCGSNNRCFESFSIPGCQDGKGAAAYKPFALPGRFSG